MNSSNETSSLGFVVGEVLVLLQTNVLALSQLSPLSDLKGFTDSLLIIKKKSVITFELKQADKYKNAE